MWIRRAMYRWLFPAALVLPLWLLIGWSVFGRSGWAFLWLIFIAIPSVLIAQVVLALLVRARPSVAESRAVSWLDVAGFGVWHALTIFVGFFVEVWFGVALAAAIVAVMVVFWLSIRQLRQEAERGPGIFMRIRERSSAASSAPTVGMAGPDQRPHPSQVTIITDAPKDADRS